MRIMAVRSRVSPFLIAVVLLVQLSPTLAETRKDGRRGPVEVTFTKWRTAVLPQPGAPTRLLSEGFVGGDLGAGGFVGEVLNRPVSTPCTALAPPCTPGITPPRSPDQSLRSTPSMRSRRMNTLSSRSSRAGQTARAAGSKVSSFPGGGSARTCVWHSRR